MVVLSLTPAGADALAGVPLKRVFRLRMGILRRPWIGLLILQALLLAADGFGEAPRPYRVISDLDLRVFACSPNPGHHVISSESDLMEEMRRLSSHCRPADFHASKARFLSGLDAANVRWQQESLVVLEEWYGTGMARGHLEVSQSRPGVVDATIVWKVPPPPVTPDTTVFRSAFAVRKGAVTEIKIRGKNRKTITVPMHR